MAVHPGASDKVLAILLANLLIGFEASVAAGTWLYRRFGGQSLLASEPRPVVPWGPLSIIAALVLSFELTRSLFWIFGRMHPGAASIRDRLIINGLATMTMVALVPLLLRHTSGARPGDLGLATRNWRRELFRGVAGCALAVPLVYLIQFAAVQVWPARSHPVQQALMADRTVLTGLVTLISAVIIAPIGEEILFRGVLLGWLWKAASPGVTYGGLNDRATHAGPGAWGPTGDLMANIAASLFFASLHADQWPAPIPLFVLSMGFGEVYRRSGSLLAPIAMHACFNGLSTAALFIGVATGASPPPL